MRWSTRMFLAALLCAGLAPPASALRLAAIDAMTSTVMQEGQSSFSGLAVRARLTSTLFVQGIEFMPAMEYWRNASSLEPFDIRTTRKDATLGADVRYAFRSSSVKPYVGAGYALHFLSSTVDAPSLGMNNESDAIVKGGFALTGGMAFPISRRFDNFLELKYHHVPSYRQLKLNWGLAINL